jgi:DNA-binding MarR family transcriptional regulator
MAADLGPLHAAVHDDWDLARNIADRAGADRRSAGQKLAALEKQGFVESKWDEGLRLTWWRRAR